MMTSVVSNMRPFVVSILTVILGGGIAVADCDWDDRYAAVLEGVDFTAIRGGEPRARGLIYSGFVNWEKKQDYGAVRELVNGLIPVATTMARVEIGNGYAGSYKVAWVIQGKRGLWLITNMRGGVEAELLPRESVDHLTAKMEGIGVWSLKSAVDTAVDDGSTTFFSYCSGDRIIQFGVYGLPLGSELLPVDQQFAERVLGQRQAVRAVLELIKSDQPVRDQR